MREPVFHRAAELSAEVDVPHGFFTRQGGVSHGIYDSLNCGLGSDDRRADVLENRARVCAALKANHLVTAHQTHSTVTAFIDAAPNSEQGAIKADALVTKTPGLAIGALAADCGPVLLHDAQNSVIGAAHSGWRGAFDGILASVVDTMCAHGATPATITAVIGPCISGAAYEVGAEFFARFENERKDDCDLFVSAERDSHFMFDLPRFIARQLARCGVRVAPLQSAHRCTYQNEADYFSYRRTTHRGEADYGRQISAICLPVL